MELNRKNMQKLALLAGGAILFYWVLQNPEVPSRALGVLVGLFAPFLMGMALAFILNVPMRALEKRLFPPRKPAKGKALPLLYRMRRPLSLLLTIVLVVAVVVLVFVIVIPEVRNTFQTLRALIPGFLESVRGWSDRLAAQIPMLTEWLSPAKLEWNNILKTAAGFLQSGAMSVFTSTMGIATSVFSGIFNFFIGLIFAIYLLCQKETLARQVKKTFYAYLPEERADRLISVCALADRTFSNFLTGQCLEAVILGSMFFFSMWLLRFPYALMISVLIAFTALIPIFGAFIGCAVGAFLILVASPVKAFWFVLLFLLLQQIEGNLIYPRVVGGSVGLPAMWVLLAVLVGGSTLGVLGMLVMVPLCSVLYALLRESVNRRLAERRTPPRKYDARKQ